MSFFDHDITVCLYYNIMISKQFLFWSSDLSWNAPIPMLSFEWVFAIIPHKRGLLYPLSVSTAFVIIKSSNIKTSPVTLGVKARLLSDDRVKVEVIRLRPKALLKNVKQYALDNYSTVTTNEVKHLNYHKSESKELIRNVI